MNSSTDSEYYNPDTAAYYFAGAAGQQDHAVDIVGWDDNYAAANFSRLTDAARQRRLHRAQQLGNKLGRQRATSTSPTTTPTSPTS